MKKTVKLNIFLLLLLSSSSLVAQYGNNGYGNSGMGGNGMRNGVERNSPPPIEKQETPEEIVARFVEKLKPELKLDALQEIAIQQVMVSSIKEQGVIYKKETDQETKAKELQEVNETSKLKVIALLNPEQKEKYKLLLEDKKFWEKNSKKDKKARKKDKKSETNLDTQVED